MAKSKASWIWVLQAVSGIALALLLGMHWVAQHYLASGGLRNYAQVVAFLQNPLAFIMEIAFLVVVTAHALLGVRAILLDLGLQPGRQRFLNFFLGLLGVLTVIYGFQLAWQVAH
jgi:succinate dehydrogenase / fumarate reductase, membrane anchor subunit